MATYRIREASELLGVSDDTVRRWVEAGKLAASTDTSRRRVVDGAELAAFARARAEAADAATQSTTGAATRATHMSARNRLTGLVTQVVRDKVMAQVEIQAGPFRVVSLMSREAADDLGLEPGVLAVASIKSTNVVVEVP